MGKILLTNSENSIFEADLIRYFEYDNESFLIYTLNEYDEKNYIKLYLVEILEELGEPISYTINDEDVWKSMQTVVRNVIKEIKADTRILLKDLDPIQINNIKISEMRYFKLDKKLVSILSSDYLEYNEKLNSDAIAEISDESMDEDFIIEPIDLPLDELIIVKYKEEEKMEENIIEVENITATDSNIDYKALYFALKEEQEAKNIVIDNLLDKLNKYKDIYGELN